MNEKYVKKKKKRFSLPLIARYFLSFTKLWIMVNVDRPAWESLAEILMTNTLYSTLSFDMTSMQLTLLLLCKCNCLIRDTPSPSCDFPLFRTTTTTTISAIFRINVTSFLHTLFSGNNNVVTTEDVTQCCPGFPLHVFFTGSNEPQNFDFCEIIESIWKLCGPIVYLKEQNTLSFQIFKLKIIVSYQTP